MIKEILRGVEFWPEIEDCLRVEQILEIVKKFEPRFVYELCENNEFQNLSTSN